MDDSRPGNWFVATYSGIGDAISNTPLIRHLLEQSPFQVFTVGNPFYECVQKFGTTSQRWKTVDTNARRVFDEPGEFIKFARSCNIINVANLRRDAVVDPVGYSAGIAEIEAAGIAVIDAMELLEQRPHILEIGKSILQTAGFEPIKEKTGWLRQELKPEGEKRSSQIGFFTGASNQTKRMNANFWVDLIVGTYARTSLHPLLISGTSEDDIALHSAIRETLTDLGVAFDTFEDATLLNVLRRIASLSQLVSNDTFAIHAAHALDIPCVGLFASTDPHVYAPLTQKMIPVASNFYSSCPDRNGIGNCAGWADGCAHEACKESVTATEAMLAIARNISSKQRTSLETITK